MRKTIFNLAALSILVFCSCCSSGTRQPLMGGDITHLIESVADEVMSTAEEVKSTAEEVKSAVEDIRKSLDGESAVLTVGDHNALAVPAPLNDREEQILSRVGYTTSYNKDLRIPNWVAWRLTADHTDGPHKRGGIKFQEDYEVPAPRATDTDYRSSGYDRGHMCPSGDNKWDAEAQQQSFLFTNICPQGHNLNAGDWNEMEGKCRRWAEKYGELFIVCGPILYKGAHKTIGKNKVVVPEAFFKVVLRMGNNPSAIGFIYKNEDGNRPMGDYVNSVDQVERITRIDFFPALPDSLENIIESKANLKDWK